MEFQFLRKDKAYTYLDMHADSFEEEKAQLQAQGWELAEEIEAKDKKDAIEQYKSRHTNFAAKAAAIGAAIGFFGS
ncbi:hypothetical protein L4C36_17435 [Photobacterium japonica]|uniref:hypothetical protein n=1 Tax=Photobacterium japonica TaxID=2910235 RepID=UPI003D14E939